MKITTAIVPFFLAFCFYSCDFVNEKTAGFSAPDPAELLQVEKNFSQMSRERGMKKAFLHYIAGEAVLLRSGEDPIVGADAIESLSLVNDEGYHISWEPYRAEIASDGNMGYTYGIFTIEAEGNRVRGTYVNVWQKQHGQWRFVLNSANQGLSGE